MIYESKTQAYHILCGKNRILKFRKNGDGFGQLDTKIAAVQTGMTEEEIKVTIEGDKGFKKGLVEGALIWPKTVRAKAEQAATTAKLLEAAQLTDAQIRAKIARLGGKTPVKATRPELIAALNDAFMTEESVKDETN